MLDHIIITIIIYCFGGLSFWAFMANFNKKKYFSSGLYLFTLIGAIVMLVRFIINMKS